MFKVASREALVSVDPTCRRAVHTHLGGGDERCVRDGGERGVKYKASAAVVTHSVPKNPVLI